MNFITSRIADSESQNWDLRANENPAQYSCSIASNIEVISISLICFSGSQSAIQILVKSSSFHFLFLFSVAEIFEWGISIRFANSVTVIHRSSLKLESFLDTKWDQVASKSFISVYNVSKNDNIRKNKIVNTKSEQNMKKYLTLYQKKIQ